jgi:hypothetical protein
MGVNWGAALIHWHPHARRDGQKLTLAHVHPFHFEMRFEPREGRPGRVVHIQVGFTCHVFTCDISDAGPEPELYSDRREVRAFDLERYKWSFRLKEIVMGLERRKCYFARRDHFVTFERGVGDDQDYRVFFTMRRKDSSTVHLIVQSAYLGAKDARPHGQTKRPILFRSIVSNVVSKRKITEAP